MTITVDLQNGSSATGLPPRSAFVSWVNAALPTQSQAMEISIRLVDEAESAQLNQTYRHKSGPTNVLSFPADLPPHVTPRLLGDLVICAGVVTREASEQGKADEAHWAHMVIHGTLHLLGYDHINASDAKRMEALEIEILDTLQYPNPYLSTVPA